jgi:hypothetical protein
LLGWRELFLNCKEMEKKLIEPQRRKGAEKIMMNVLVVLSHLCG